MKSCCLDWTSQIVYSLLNNNKEGKMPLDLYVKQLEMIVEELIKDLEEIQQELEECKNAS